MSSILHFGSARQESWLAPPGWLYTIADVPSPPPLLCKTNDPKGRMFGHLDKAALEKQNKTGICFTLKPPSCEGHQLSFRVIEAQGHIYVGRGKGGGVEQAVCLLKFTLSLQGAQIKPSECGHAALASGPALAAAGGRLSVHLGCAAARAGGALSASYAVCRAAVLRGWWRGRDLLPSCRLPCVGVDVPQGPCQEGSDHKRCKRNAHHGERVQAMENLWRRRNWTGIFSVGNIFFIIYLEDHSQGLGERLLILHHGPDHGGI